jgi:hypothetical protein
MDSPEMSHLPGNVPPIPPFSTKKSINKKIYKSIFIFWHTVRPMDGQPPGSKNQNKKYKNILVYWKLYAGSRPKTGQPWHNVRPMDGHLPGNVPPIPPFSTTKINK